MTICKDIDKIIKNNLQEILSLRSKRVLKSDGSYVTEGDLLCQKLILDYLNYTGDNFEIVSEEIDSSNFKYDQTKNYAVVDPIDGTENFTSGLKEWGVSVAIYRSGKHDESIISMPEIGTSIITNEFKGNQHSYSRIHALSTSSISTNNLERIGKGEMEYRVTGCCIYNIHNVINGLFQSYESEKANVWDILAGINLSLENGLDVFIDGEKYDGKFLLPNKKYWIKVQRKND